MTLTWVNCNQIKYMDVKCCTSCQTIKPITMFHTCHGIPCSKCKLCKNAMKKESSAKRTFPSIESKSCKRCNQTLHVEMFTKTIGSKDGYSAVCKNCRSLEEKERRDFQRNLLLNPPEGVKQCNSCMIFKSYQSYRANRRSNDGFSSECFDCKPKCVWTAEQQRQSERKYRQNNPDKLKEKYKRQAQNVNRRIRDSLNHRISELLRSHGEGKRNTTLQYVGCSKDYLKGWLEYQFEDGMSWDNYGEWHIDHVRPCSSFNLSLESEQLVCFHWSNLKPMWGLDNIIKSNKIIDSLIEEQHRKSTVFEMKFSAQVKGEELLG